MLWIAALVGALSTYTRQASIEDLYAAVAAGQVDSVTIIDQRADGTTGPVLQEVRWRDGWVPRVATVFTLRPEREPSGSELEVTSQDVAVVLWAMSLGLLINGPQPWRATRWAWFWLLTPPLGPLLFLALSGPTPGLPTPKRVTRCWF